MEKTAIINAYNFYGDKMKKATLSVDLDAILYNYRHIKCYYKKNVIAVLKDNAYGIGLSKIAHLLENEEGIIIAINTLEEAIKLRSDNYTKDILYLNVFDKDDLDTIKEYNLSVIVSTPSQLKLVKNTNIKFHLKINTGMNRLGLTENEAISVINKLNTQEDNYNFTGVMTHFADEDMNNKSYNLFKSIVSKINKKDIFIHCYSSKSLKNNVDDITNYVRVGLKLYGIGERSSFLHNALTLKTPIIYQRKVSKNQSVGYDYDYLTSNDGYLYILPLGYGQGWGRFNKSLAFVNGMYLTQAGKISMDYSTYFSRTIIDSNERIELFGSKIPLESICKINDIDPHEILVKLKVNIEYQRTLL